MKDDCKEVVFSGISLVEGKEPNVNFKIRDCINERTIELSIPRSEMTPKKVENAIVSNNGICEDAEEIFKNLIQAYNNNLRTQAIQIRRFYESVGWKMDNGTIIYCGDNAISNCNIPKSEYCGNIDLVPCGSIDNIVSMIKSEITGQPDWCKLEAVLCISVGSLVLAYANVFWDADINNLILHLFGGSSNGKSTALSLFVSVASNPTKKKGFWLSYSSTEGYLIKWIGNNNGLPVTIDEISGVTKKERHSFVYPFRNGEEKGRLKAGGVNMQESAVFQMVILSSGEVSLLRKCTQNEGLRARCIEFPNEMWTISSAQAKRIKACLKKNYALIAPLVAQSLMEDSEYWKKRWEYYRKLVETEITARKITCSIKDRVGEYVALFTLAGEIINKTLNVDLDIEEIYKFCFLHIVVANDDEANMARNAYYTIINYISEHQDLFADCTFIGGARTQFDSIYLDADKEGFFYDCNDHEANGVIYNRVYVFRPGKVESILADAGFTESRVALYKLRKEKLLKTKDAKRNTFNYVINDVELKCIAVYYVNNTGKVCDLGEDEE